MSGSGTWVPPGKQQFFLPGTMTPLAGGQVFMYVPATSTPKNTYQDQAETTLNTNPITLDANGECTIWGDGLYRQILQDSVGNQIWDQVTGFISPSSSVVFASPADVVAGTSNTEVISPYALAQSGVLGGATVKVSIGTATRTLNASLSDYANVNDYLNTGDTTYDGAISRAVAAKGKAYFPKQAALTGGKYVVSGTIVPANGQAFFGDGSDETVIECSTANVPVFMLGTSIYGFLIKGLTVQHSGTATAGGDGIAQGQGLTDWADDSGIYDVKATKNYVGFNLGKAFYAEIFDCEARANIREGFKFTTTGNSTVVSGSAGGPLQWYVLDCLSQLNGWDGYSYNVTGTGFGGAGVGSSVGTLENPKTYANGHHGIAYYGSAAQPLNSARVTGGFLGNDAANGIYIDGYARDHVIIADFVEQCGQYGVEITANNADTFIQVKLVSGNTWDGVYTFGNNTVIGPGIYVNNGTAGTGVDNFAGINVAGGYATIGAISSGNFNSSIQQYGIRTAVDAINVTGARLPGPGTTGVGSGQVNGLTLSAVTMGNALAPIYWAVGPTASIVTGCLPVTCNTGAIFTGGTVAGNLVVTGDTTTNTLHVNSASAFAGGITVTGSGITLTTGVPSNGITVDNILVNYSVGIATAPDGIAGHLGVNSAIKVGAPTGGYVTGTVNAAVNLLVNGASIGIVGGVYTGNLTVTGDVTANTLHVSAASAFGGSVNLTGGASIYGTSGSGLQIDNATFNDSIGVGTAATGVAGQIKGTTGVFSGALSGSSLASSSTLSLAGAITGASTINASGLITGGSVTAGTITSTVDLIASGTAHLTGTGVAMSGGVTISSGGIAVTGGVVADNIKASTSGSVGTGASGVSGIFNLEALTYAGLPSAASVGSGAMAFITDCNTSTFLATAAGGGSTKVTVISNGSNWLVN